MINVLYFKLQVFDVISERIFHCFLLYKYVWQPNPHRHRQVKETITSSARRERVVENPVTKRGRGQKSVMEGPHIRVCTRLWALNRTSAMSLRNITRNPLTITTRMRRLSNLSNMAHWQPHWNLMLFLWSLMTVIR